MMGSILSLRATWCVRADRSGRDEKDEEGFRRKRKRAGNDKPKRG